MSFNRAPSIIEEFSEQAVELKSLRTQEMKEEPKCQRDISRDQLNRLVESGNDEEWNKIEIIDLSNFELSGVEIKVLFETLIKLSPALELHTLNLTETGLKRKGIDLLNKFLQKYRKLKNLFLNQNRLGRQYSPFLSWLSPAEALIDNLYGYEGLQELGLNKVGLTELEANRLIDSIVSFESLVNINLANNHLLSGTDARLNNQLQIARTRTQIFKDIVSISFPPMQNARNYIDIITQQYEINSSQPTNVASLHAELGRFFYYLLTAFAINTARKKVLDEKNNLSSFEQLQLNSTRSLTRLAMLLALTNADIYDFEVLFLHFVSETDKSLPFTNYVREQLNKCILLNSNSITIKPSLEKLNVKKLNQFQLNALSLNKLFHTILPKTNHRLSNLQSLNLANLTALSFGDLERILKECNALEVLSLQGHKLGNPSTSERGARKTGSNLKKLIPTLRSLSKLKTLGLDNNKLKDSDASELESMIDSFPGFSRLTFSKNRICQKSSDTLDTAVKRARERLHLFNEAKSSRWKYETQSIKSHLEPLAFNPDAALRAIASFMNKIIDIFTPSSQKYKEDLEVKKLQRLTDHEGWQNAAMVITSKFVDLLTEIQNAPDKKYSDHTNCLLNLRKIEELFIQFIGKGWLQANDPKKPIVEFYELIVILKNKISKDVAQKEESNAVKAFRWGMLSRLNGIYESTYLLEAKLIEPIKNITSEAKYQNELEIKLETLHHLSFGILALLSILSIAPASTVLASVGFTHSVAKIVESVVELYHAVDVVPHLKHKAVHKFVKWIFERDNRKSLDTATLVKGLHGAFKDKREFGSFHRWVTEYSIHRHETIINTFDSEEAERIGSVVAERVLEPFMLGLKVKPDTDLHGNNIWLPILELISSWTYYSATIPLLLKRSEAPQTFTTLNGEKLTLDAILAPAGFCLNDTKGVPIYIIVDPIARIMVPILKEHLGMKELARQLVIPEMTTPRLTGYCNANTEEVSKLKLQTLLPEQHEPKATTAITINKKNKYAHILESVFQPENTVDNDSEPLSREPGHRFVVKEPVNRLVIYKSTPRFFNMPNDERHESELTRVLQTELFKHQQANARVQRRGSF